MQSMAFQNLTSADFRPPYCPNPNCPCHDISFAKTKGRFIHFGTRAIRRPPFLSQRFRCLICRRTFTSSFFTFSYRDRLPDTYEEIFLKRVCESASKRTIARALNHSLDTVLRRLTKISRQSFLHWAKDLENLLLKETIAYDGIENFSFSQFDPNSINHAIGRESLFVYDFNFSPLNRKGRKTPAQQQKQTKLDKAHGRYPGKAIEASSMRIFARLFAMSPALVLHTDDHHMYRNAIRRLGIADKIDHQVTLSSVKRNYRNKLFAINHLDMLTRHHLCDFKRETIAFAKTSIAMIESFALLAAYKNYLRPMFVKKHRKNPRAHIDSPAVNLNLRQKTLSFNEFFYMRLSRHQVRLNQDWEKFFARVDEYSRQPVRRYAGIC